MSRSADTPLGGELDPAADAALAVVMPLLRDHDEPAWIVGGAVRDLVIGRPVDDVDVAVASDSSRLARHLHGALGGDIFSLSDRFGTWRVQPEAQTWRIDVTPLRGDTIEADLAERDFTATAMALPVIGPPIAIDPFGGREDIAAATLRVLGERAYRDDPLRPLRLPRLAAQLGFTAEPQTADLTRRFAPGVGEAAPERVFAELRTLVGGGHPLRGLELMLELGLMQVVLPEIVALGGVDQSVYHHKDVLGHTLEVLAHLIELERDLETVFGPSAPRIHKLLEQPLADEMTRGQALRWAALLHDVAKPQTRVVRDNGRVGFPGHDTIGAQVVREICRRLRTSDKFAAYVAALTQHHLRLGFLVGHPLDAATRYDYLSACEPVAVEVGVLSVADRLATGGRKADVATPPHLELARAMAAPALAWQAWRQQPPLLRGDELAARLGIAPGPRLGELLAAIDRARYTGQVETAQQAVELARELAAREP